MSGEPVRVAVVGVGEMGSNHVRVYKELPSANLVGVVESDPERAGQIEEEYDVKSFATIDSLPEGDAVSISVPSHLHRDVAIECIECGLDVLVEKPLATTLDDARAIVSAAEENDVRLMVGHIERYNPVIEALEEILESESVLAFDAHRLGPYTEQLSDDCVVTDLMIHDLDVVTHLIAGDVRQLNAIGSFARSTQSDHAIVQMELSGGAIGSLTASHITHDKVRKLKIMTEDHFIIVDYHRQNIDVKHWGTIGSTTLGEQSGYRTENIVESPYVNTREPLKAELEHFLNCIRNDETPMTDGESGVKALSLVSRIKEQMGT